MRRNANLEISVFSGDKFRSATFIEHPVCAIYMYLFPVIVLRSARKDDEFCLSIDTPLILLLLIWEKLVAISLIHVLPPNKGVLQNIFTLYILEDGKVFSQSNTS